ncbi:MAG: flavodoxin domain-containing protein [Euryarchaeota archaeon]|nr:flavodoxin domain-containing protein [Euryarchaeota archaeon]MBU4221193.1 flavodoxin domain-containing protein [Euryarchaeota archaeon]MBU4340676.1 flavodoxin domain-containing protein [Euryarchaeota archaeon]MBU4454313.1 flavodoxin domain-containing protein [Euryarchaeota archaeon]MCG2737365.1 flavodoxin domain-containing protein [Candidatus Methanoperedenaceae archaeon]
MTKLVIIFGTGSHNTELMAKAIQEGAAAEGIDTILKNVNDAESTDVADADAIAIGSPNYNYAMMPTVRKFLNDIDGIDLSGKVGLSFGSYGWSLEATDEINRILTSYGMEMIKDLLIKRMPGEEELELCRRVGSLLACKIMKLEVLCAV